MSAALPNRLEEVKLSTEDSLQLLDEFYRLADKLELNETLTKSYVTWILKYLKFYQSTHPIHLKQVDVEAYLAYLVTELNTDYHAIKTATNALKFLYQNLLNVAFEDLQLPRQIIRRGFFSRFGERHCFAVINYMSGPTQLMAKLAMHANLKLRQVINLRLGDVDLKKATIIVRDKNGNKQFIANLPVQIALEIRIQMMKVKALLQKEKERECAASNSELTILAKSLEPDWQYLFPYHFARLTNKSASPLNQVPIKILKNDIQIAIKNYIRFKPNTNAVVNAKPIRFSTGITKISDKPLLSKQLLNDSWSPNNVQQTFNFDNERGAA